jgi:hypothetical protein
MGCYKKALVVLPVSSYSELADVSIGGRRLFRTGRSSLRHIPPEIGRSEIPVSLLSGTLPRSKFAWRGFLFHPQLRRCI